MQSIDAAKNAGLSLWWVHRINDQLITSKAERKQVEILTKQSHRRT